LTASWVGLRRGGGEESRTDLFAGDVVGSELDLAHAAGAESLCEGVVAEDLGGPCAGTGTGRHRQASLCVRHGQSKSTCGSFSLSTALFTSPLYPVLPQHPPPRQHCLSPPSVLITPSCCTPTTASTPVAAPIIPNVTFSDSTLNPTANDTTCASF